MSQVLSIVIGDNHVNDALNQFLTRWESVGHFSSDTDGYVLVLMKGDSSMLSVEGDTLLLQGEFGDQGVEIMTLVADSFGSRLLLENEVLEPHKPYPNWKNMGVAGKSLTISVGLVLFPVAIILLPVLFFIALFRLGYSLLFSAEK